MLIEDEEIHALSNYLVDEIILAFGVKRTPATHRLFDFFFRGITNRLSAICVLTDRKIAMEGFPAATGWMAGHRVQQVSMRGAETIPPSDPLLMSAHMTSWSCHPESTGGMLRSLPAIRHS
jgi:hypothetical protein